MAHRMLLLLAGLLIATAILPAPAAAQNGVLVWRPRQSALEKPKTTPQAAQCSGNVCSSSHPLETAEPVELKPNYYYEEHFDPGCRDGVVRVDSRWTGSSEMVGVELWSGNTLVGQGQAGSGANNVAWDQPFAVGGQLTALVYNGGQATIDVGGFGRTVGCYVRVNDLRLQLEFNAKRDGRYGINVHTSFAIANQLGAKSLAVAYFGDSVGNPLRDRDGAYSTTGGTVSASTTFTPGYQSARYDRLTIFIPYDQLHVAEGRRHDLTVSVALFDAATTTMVADSELSSFWIH